ncbi:rhodanese-like domain-containing protein [Rhodoferax sp.]|uniref:rhodanese-like domain-containing protein n=1 Tax=Rhodoferax sp. TaxID=50421 RepID=UPI0019E43BD0|nr:rhodanese-like domain-containing protein [Rhodoferax sp.]MBE0472587.1 rhodanese-like domain-containing protein [Rhodoferax sp.]
MEHIHPKQAVEILSANPDTLFIDCRTEAEFYYVGHPTDAVNIEWNTEPDFELNPHFCDAVLSIAGRKERPVILICRSGNRSVDAGLALEKFGFTNVSNVLEGFEGPLDPEHHRGTKGGWRFHGLSWRQL